MLVDSHCHLQDSKFEFDLDGVIERAAQAGVGAMVVVGYDMPSSRLAVELADNRTNLYAAIGVHPHDAKDLKSRNLEELSRLADSASVVAIGETGLDYYRNLSPPADQKVAFRAQLDLALALRLPVVVHSRDADAKTFEILAEYERQALPRWPKDRPLGVMHCFAGDLPLALRYIELGFVISVSGTVTYPNAVRTRGVASGIPLRWMTIETDAPYLPPQSIRGQRNEPARVKEVAEFVASLRGCESDEVRDRTAQTAAWLFGIGEIGTGV